MRLTPRPKAEIHSGTQPDTPASGPSRLAKFIGGFLRLFLALALWAAILLAIALFLVPAKTPVDNAPSSRHATVKVTQDSFTDVEVCSGCHWTIFKQWSGSMHAFANADPIYASLYDLANKDTNGKAEQYCAASRCHTPVGFLLGENPFPHDRMSPIAQRAVFCDFCHTVSRSRGIGDASYVSSPGRVKRGPYRNAESPYHLTAYSPLHKRAEFCGMCHNVSSPITGLKLETTYDEWRRSPQSRRGIVCQDCHMKPFAGKAAEIAPRRPRVFSHRFGGANSVVPPLLGEPARRPLAIAQLRSAARLSVASARRTGNSVQLQIKVANVGAGHSLPTGVTELREMWLEVAVRSGEEEVYTSGAIDRDGTLDPKAHVFHVVLADEGGNPVTKVWRGVSVLIDHRVPAGKSVMERFRFNVPNGTGRLRVSAKLLYRTAPQGLVDQLLGKGKVRIPVIEMARTHAAL